MSYPNTNTPEEERDEARTPLWLFKWLDERFHFGVDLAATADNTLCPLYFDRAADSLEAHWHLCTSTGFLNPPYSNLGPWLLKAGRERWEGFTTVMVIPAPNGEAHTRLLFDRATEIIDIVGRVNFLRPDGVDMKGNNRGTCVAVFGSDLEMTHRVHRRWYVMRDGIKSKCS